MTETRTAVDKGSHDWKTAVKRALGSRDRRMCAGTERLSALVIFCRSSGSLMYGVSDSSHESDKVMNTRLNFEYCTGDLNAPFSVVAAHGSLVNGPDVVQYKLHEHGFEVSAFEMFTGEHSLRLRIEIEVSPEDLLQH